MGEGSSGCCGPLTQPSKVGLGELRMPVVVDLLFLDNELCGRCRGAEGVLERAVADVAPVLGLTGRGIVVNRVKINSRALAREHRFVSSPTIRLNGNDVQRAGSESRCEACGSLCGDEVDCRTWEYRGQHYSTPPEAMLVEAILSAAYCPQPAAEPNEGDYVMPENLERFFAGVDKRSRYDDPPTAVAVVTDQPRDAVT